MKLLNYHKPSLDAFSDDAEKCEIEFQITNDGKYHVTNWLEFKEQVITIQSNYFNKKSKREIETFPPFEIHPYISFNNSLNSNHKTLILGTFPPPSYLHKFYPKLSNQNFLKNIDIDQRPPLLFFYGNRGSLWEIIDTNLDLNSINHYLDTSKIFISDIVLFTQRKSFTIERASDNNYINIIPNVPLIKQLIDGEKFVDNIVFTSKKWDIADGRGRGRRKANYVPQSIKFTEENSAISLFFRCLECMNIQFGFQKLSSNETLQFIPENYSRIKKEFTNLFAFNLIVNNKVFQLNLGDSPSGGAISPFDSNTFLRWIRHRFGEPGIQIIRNHPRNSKLIKIKKERKNPIQSELNYPEGSDICIDFQRDMYNMFLERNFPLIEQIQNQEV